MIKYDENWASTKYIDFVPLTCDRCFCTFYKEKRETVKTNFRKQKNHFCSKKCMGEAKVTSHIVNCGHCHKLVQRTKQQFSLSKSGNVFCNRSCAASYNNTHKKHGCKRSKLEAWLEQQLTNLHPKLEIHFNQKDAINSELDIYIPSLKLAFELNGIFHYEPIYGSDKLGKIQNNDQRKFQACLEQGIEMCIIDTSKQINFKERSSQKFLDIILQVLSVRLKRDLTEDAT